MPKLRADLLEKMLAVLVVLGLCLLILVQVGLYRGSLQPDSSWYGASYDAMAVSVAADWDEPYGVLTWELVDLSRLELAEIWQNGEKAADFSRPEVTLRVYDGDRLELDATAYGKPVRICLKKASAGVDTAFLLRDVEVCGERIELGQVVLQSNLFDRE